MSYIHPHMSKALKHHTLDLIAEVEGVSVYRMHRPGHSEYRVQITFTPEGIAIQGDVGLGDAQNGICSRLGYGREWFGGRKSESYLCEKFLRKTWQREVAKRDIERWVRDAETELKEARQTEIALRPDEEPADILADTDFPDEEHSVRAWKAIWEVFGDDTTEAELYEVGSEHFADFWDYEVGSDYPLADAGWLCAIQQRFAELLAEQ